MGAVTGAIIGAAGAIGGGLLAKKGAEKSAATAAKSAKDASAQVAAQINQARQDIQKLMPTVEQNIQAGGRSALNTLQQGTGQQMQAMLGGNVAAQQILGQSMPQFQAAILGQGMPSAPSIYQQQLPQINYAMPETVSPNAALYGVPQQSQKVTKPQVAPPNFGNLIGERGKAYAAKYLGA